MVHYELRLWRDTNDHASRPLLSSFIAIQAIRLEKYGAHKMKLGEPLAKAS